MVTFYPGPSKLYPEVEGFLRDAYHSGLLSVNHRSKPFMEMLSEAVSLLKQKLAVPAGYEVVFVSSATECWEIIAQSLTGGKSYHLYNGAFGSKWAEYAARIHGRAVGVPYDLDAQPVWNRPESDPSDLLCITHTETSNGTMVTDESLAALRSQFKGLIAVDATSSMGGVALPWESADVWYASVQKCFGLPSGLGVMLLSPGAIAQAAALGEEAHYNSLGFVVENFKKFQTPYTPNILGIYLVKRLMETLRPVDIIGRALENRALALYNYLETNGYEPLVKSALNRSPTVIAVKGSAEEIAGLKVFAAQNGITLGNGYGKWKDTTFRIANFPAIRNDEADLLKACLKDFKNN